MTQCFLTMFLKIFCICLATQNIFFPFFQLKNKLGESTSQGTSQQDAYAELSEDDSEEEEVAEINRGACASASTHATASASKTTDEPPLPSLVNVAERRKQKKASAAAKSSTSTSSTGDISHAELLKLLTARAVDTEMLKTKIDELITCGDVRKQEKMNFGQWVGSRIMQVPDEHFDAFQQDCFKYIMENTSFPNVTTTSVATTASVTTTLAAAAANVAPTIAAPTPRVVPPFQFAPRRAASPRAAPVDTRSSYARSMSDPVSYNVAAPATTSSYPFNAANYSGDLDQYSAHYSSSTYAPGSAFSAYQQQQGLQQQTMQQQQALPPMQQRTLQQQSFQQQSLQQQQPLQQQPLHAQQLFPSSQQQPSVPYTSSTTSRAAMDIDFSAPLVMPPIGASTSVSTPVSTTQQTTTTVSSVSNVSPAPLNTPTLNTPILPATPNISGDALNISNRSSSPPGGAV